MHVKIEIGIDDRNKLAVIEFSQKQQLYAGARPTDVLITGAYDKEELSALILQLEQAYDQL